MSKIIKLVIIDKLYLDELESFMHNMKNDETISICEVWYRQNHNEFAGHAQFYSKNEVIKKITNEYNKYKTEAFKKIGVILELENQISKLKRMSIREFRKWKRKNK